MIVQRRCTSCCSSVENIPLQAERHSARRQELFAFPPESAFTFRPECCSGSQRNRVRLHSGIAFTFDRIPQVANEGSVQVLFTERGYAGFEKVTVGRIKRQEWEAQSSSSWNEWDRSAAGIRYRSASCATCNLPKLSAYHRGAKRYRLAVD